MPRKQRFKPSRKPKAVGTLTEFAPIQQVEPAIASIEAARPQEAVPPRPDLAGPEERPAEDRAQSMISLGGDAG